MKRDPNISLTLSPPRHGWLSMSLVCGDFALVCAASNVLNDALDEFLALYAFACHPGSRGVRVCLWTEPDGYAIDVAGSREGRACDVRISHDACFIPPMHGRDMALQAQFTASSRNIADALELALTGLFAGCGTGALEKWRPRQGYEEQFRNIKRARGRGG